MKKIKYLLFILPLLLMHTSCKEGEFLEEVNPNAITTELFWQTEDDFQAALVSAYNVLQFKNVGGANVSSFENVKSDIGRSFTFYDFSFTFDVFAWNDSEPYTEDRWSEHYVGIFRTNQIIERLAEAEAEGRVIQNAEAILGQAKFLRAAFYFWLSNAFNGAVLHTSVPKEASDFQQPFVERSKIIEDIVKPDLREALQLLPVSWNDNNTGRITKGAATALLAKVFLFDSRPAAGSSTQIINAASLDSAITYFSLLTSPGNEFGYELTANIQDNFTLEGEFNSESIFEINYSENFNDSPSDLKENLGGNEAGESTSKAKVVAPELRGGFRVSVPTYWVHELYEDDPIDTSDVRNAGSEYTQRTYWSVAFLDQDTGSVGTYYNKPYQNADDLRGIADWFNGGAESVYWKKGTSWYYKDNEDGDEAISGMNERVIRYADVLLMHAEALLMRNDGGDVDQAIDFIDQVRDRAGAFTLRELIAQDIVGGGSGRFPMLDTRAQTLVEPTAENVMHHLQFVERVLELSFEGIAIRWNDLVRWGLVDQSIDNQIDHIYIDGDSPIRLEFCGPTCIEPTKLPDAIRLYSTQSQSQQKANYNPGRDYYDVPISERNSNPNLGI